jgi:hypothetical protein
MRENEEEEGGERGGDISQNFMHVKLESVQAGQKFTDILSSKEYQG